MKNHPFSIGVDIGGTHITCAAIQTANGMVAEGTLSREICSHQAASGEILQRWAAALNATIAKLEASDIAGIGFAIPGPFDYRNGVSKMKHKFAGLYGLHIPTALAPLLTTGDRLPMRFLNDATAFAVGEAWVGEGRGFRKVVVITLGTGFGSAFIEDGVPVVAREDVPREGCLWHLPFADGIADAYFSTGWFERAYTKATGNKVEGVKTLMDKAVDEPLARSIFLEFGRNLAACLAPWLKSFGAEVLVVGGNISHALPLFEAPLQEGLQKKGVKIAISLSRMYETAALVGSARLLDDTFWKQVSAQLPNI